VIVVLEWLYISRLVPALQATVEAMQEHERRSFPFFLIMNTDALMSGIWHISILTVSGCSDRSFLLPRKQKMEPNAGRQPLGRAGARHERTLFTVGWTPLLGAA
jgi:hypothetical protein